MVLDKQELVRIAEQYYPHHWDPSASNFEKSPERKAYEEAWRRAPSFDHWIELVRAMRKDLPVGISIHDATPGYSCGSFRCCAHVKCQQLPQETKLETLVIGYRSVLAPVYGLICVHHILSPLPGKSASVSLEIPGDLQPIADVIARHIERDSGFQFLPEELAQVPVPTIYVNNIPFGQATLFDALIDSDPANVY